MSLGGRLRLQWATLAVVAGAAAVGIAAEAVAFDWSAVRSWAPDLAVGWALVACGIATRGRCGVLVWSAGFAWFAGNFAAADASAVAAIAGHLTYVHRALLAHAVLSFPAGRLAATRRRAVVGATYGIALWPALATSNVAWITVAVTVLVVADRRALPAAAALTIALGGVSLGHVLLAQGDQTALVRLYEASIVATAAALAVASTRLSPAATVDRVIELGEMASMQQALRYVLDDPELEVAFAHDGGYVDERGHPLAVSVVGRQVDAQPGGSAVVLHGPSLVLDTGLTDAVAGALRLTAEHARLQADVLEHLAELRASRRRLVLARGRQRALLAHRLREGVERQLNVIEATLADAQARERTVTDGIERARRQVLETRDSIAALARGLQPPTLATEGLAGALGRLAERSSVPVALEVDSRRHDAAVEHAAYLVCSDAVANVVKHADASHVVVRVACDDGRLRLEIADDGRGGANPDGGGLQGLCERVEELGGTLEMQSTWGAGTRLSAEIPVGADEDGSARSKRNRGSLVAGAST